MKSSSDFSFLLVGLGSIGRRHLEILSRRGVRVTVVDPDYRAQEFLRTKSEYQNVDFYSDLNDLPKSLVIDIATISNWGPDHINSVLKIRSLGVRKFFIEKPIASKIKSLLELKQMIMSGEIQVVTNLPFSYGVLAKRLVDYCEQSVLGGIVSIVVQGGAKCLATNGIHYVGLSNKIFNSQPESVSSIVNISNINPRNPMFSFVEGVATWHYENRRHLTVSFSNTSHLQLCITVNYTYGKVIIEENVANVYSINNNNRSKIRKPTDTFYPNELIDTFDAVQDTRKLDGMEYIYERIFLGDQTLWNDYLHGFESTEAIIAMLISNSEQKVVKLPLNLATNVNYMSHDWLIS